MRVWRWINLIGAGLLAGLIATLVMALVMLVLRYGLGITAPPEALPDRIAPTLDIDTFFGLFRTYGGYNGLKKFGIRSGLLALIGVGTLVGAIYAAIVERERSHHPGIWRSGFSPRGWRFVIITAVVFWVSSLIALAPVLGANYRGLSPAPATVANALGLLVSYAAFAATLILVYRFLVAPALAVEPRPTVNTEPLIRPMGELGRPVDRRALIAGVAGAALIAPSYGIMRRMYHQATFFYDGTRFRADQLSGVTPNDQFYVVTKNVVDPRPTKAFWGLEVNGHVDNARRYDFDQLAAMEPVKVEATLSCISNAVGDRLMSNAIWTGVPMARLLDEAGVKKGAVEVRLHGADGYTDTFAIDKAMESTTLVAYRMNNEEIPQRHGYPVRLIVPGLFGEKNVKWVTGIEVVDFDAKGFYEQQGWGPEFVVPTRSSFLQPDLRKPVKVNSTVPLKGIGFAGNRGVSKVEVSFDDGKTWSVARIDYPGTMTSWAVWTYSWRPTRAGDYKLAVRATDQAGAVQTPDRRGIISEGATGYHRVVAHVQA